jgi:FkbM family methyltransferase
MFAVQLYRFHLPGDLIFVDVGMNIGLASLYFHSTHQGHSYGFELVPDTFRAAKLNFELNLKASTKHTAYPYGLLDRDAEFTVTVDTQNSAGNSIFKESKGSPAQVSVEVKDAAVAIGKIFDAHPDSTFILKLDAEGAEFEILDRLSEQGLLGRFSLLLLELHQRDDRNSDEIRSLLRDSHFSWNESNVPLHNCSLMYAYPRAGVSQDQVALAAKETW